MQTRVELYPLPVAYPFAPDVENEAPVLPRDHPAWMRDAVALSMRARELLGKLRPVAVRIYAFWDHSVRTISIMGRSLSVDSSGSYRLG